MHDIDKKLDKVLDYHEKAPPKSQEGDLELMARLQKMCKVGRMNTMLKEFCIDHPAGLKMADKAALLVQTVPRDRLLETLASGSQEPPTKRATRGSAGLDPRHVEYGLTWLCLVCSCVSLYAASLL